MRITNQQQMALLLSRVQDIQADLLRVREQLASGKKVNKASDAPRAFEQLVDIRATLNKIEERKVSLTEGISRLNLSEDAIANAETILQRAKEIALQQRNDTSSPTERATVAKEVHQLLLNFVDAANTQVDGRYLFAGYETQTKPYSLDSVSASAVPPTISANDNNQGTTSASISIQTASSLTGDQYKITFTSATTFDVVNLTSGETVLSNQTYTSGGNIDFDGLRVVLTDNPSGPLAGDEFTIGTHNASDATVSASVSTASALKPHVYELRFTSSTAFDIVDLTTDEVLSTGNSYTSGSNIVFAGITAVVTDGTVAPQAGDVFRIRPDYGYQGDTGDIRIEVDDGTTLSINTVGSQVFSGPDADLFDALLDLHQALVTNTPKDLDTVISTLDTGLTQVTKARADIGARVNRLERVQEGLDMLALSTQKRQAALEDADVAQVASELTALETNLTASLLVLNRQFEISLLNFLR
ncbi:MAG: hypothetical protein D6704_02295 [Nitrospirae bacterium]|nr:MAG: hypothetical protein D6704_02295 [Nitrospirota bacterium]